MGLEYLFKGRKAKKPYMLDENNSNLAHKHINYPTITKVCGY